MTLLDQHCQQVPADAPRQHLMVGRSIFRPWAACEAPAGEDDDSSCASSSSSRTPIPRSTSPSLPKVQSSPPVGICAGLSSRSSANSSAAHHRRGSSTASSSSSPSSSKNRPLPRSSASSSSEPILTRLEGLVANLDETSQSSASSGRSSRSSSSSGSCPPSPIHKQHKQHHAKSKAKGKARSGAELRGELALYPGMPPPMFSPEEVALLAAQQQALHEEALLAMAGLLPGMPPHSPAGAAGPGAPGVPPFYLDEYARLLQQEHKAAGVAARKQRPKKYRCPHCQVAFSNNGQLRGHVRIHTGERPFKCEEDSCGKRFTRNEELTRHKRIHSGLRPFACQACGKRFGRKDHLKKHARTHDPAHRMHVGVAHLLPCVPGVPGVPGVPPLPHPYLYGF